MTNPAPRFARSMVVTASLGGSACCLDYWGEVEERDRLADVRLDDVEQLDEQVIAFGRSGVIVVDGHSVGLDTQVDFHGAAGFGDRSVIVGSMGTVVLYEQWGSYDWTILQAPTDATLRAVAADAGKVIVVGDEVVVTLDIETETIELVEPPAGGWGSLRVALDILGYVILAGDDGVAWLVGPDAPITAPRRLDLGVDEDILGGGYHEDDGHYWLVGEKGLALREDSPEHWRQMDAGTSADFVDFAAGAALTSGGELWDPARQRRIANVPWARGIGETPQYVDESRDYHEDPNVLIVGDSGRFAVLQGC